MQIGKYELLERLGAGGMAEVWRAQARGAGGFVKQVALKLVLESWTHDVEITQMLIDEAKLSAALDFPNIVATLDFGFADGRYFIAMELIDGIPLSVCLRELKRAGRALELDLSLHVAIETTAALAFAHAAHDEKGQPLGIVHRDVNPSNIMVSRHGAVKLADFGIAKAAGRRTQTEAGTLKGKFAYMSPEQAWGRPIDARSDVFAAGLTLFELFAMERAIDGANDIEALERARAGAVRAVPEHVPKPLRAVLRRALAPDPAQRFSSAQAMREELALCLAALPPRDVRAELGRIVETTRQSAGELRLSLASGSPASPRGASAPGTRFDRDTRPSTQVRPPSQLKRVAILAGCALLGILATLALTYPKALAPAAAPAGVPAPAALAATAPAPPPLVAPPAEPPAAKLEAPPRKRPVAVRPAAAPAGESGETATLRIQVVPWGNVWVDEEAAGQTPLAPLAVRAGRHQVRVVHPELGTQQQPVELRPGEARLLTFDLSKGRGAR